MGVYVQNNLMPGEIIVVETKLHWASLLLGIGLTLIVAFITKGIGLVVAIPIFIRYFTNEYAVTNKRVIIKHGWLGNTTLEMNFSKIESVSVAQSVFGRIFGYGSIIIAGTGGTHQQFPGIANPVHFRKALLQELPR